MSKILILLLKTSFARDNTKEWNLLHKVINSRLYKNNGKTFLEAKPSSLFNPIYINQFDENQFDESHKNKLSKTIKIIIPIDGNFFNLNVSFCIAKLYRIIVAIQ